NRALRSRHGPPERPSAGGRHRSHGRAGTGLRRRGRAPPVLAMLAPPPREAERIELMDHLDAPPAELIQNLVDITRLNRIGATQTLVRQVAPFLARLGAGGTLRVLDVGTGAADIPLAIARWGRHHGHRLTIVALDVHPTILAYAARATRDAPEVRIIGGDALEAPIRPGSVDLALCSLV